MHMHTQCSQRPVSLVQLANTVMTERKIMTT